MSLLDDIILFQHYTKRNSKFGLGLYLPEQRLFKFTVFTVFLQDKRADHSLRNLNESF